MKVLHVLNTGKFSGAENVVCQIISMFRDKSPDVEMIYCSPDGPIRETLKSKGICYVPVSGLNSKELKRVVLNVKPDIIHAHDVKAGIVAALICSKIPLILHIHNNDVSTRKLTLKSIALLLASLKSKHTFWVSKTALNSFYYKKIIERKSSVLYNIVDPSKVVSEMEMDSSEYDYDVVYCGRLSYQKNPERLINISEKLAKQKSDIKIALVGSGELSESIENLVISRNLQNNVFLLGFMNNPLKIIKCAKALVFTSRFEGTPMSALEAISLGTPIVSTPTDGLVDLIQDDFNGYLSDFDEVLVQKIESICSSPELYMRLSNNQRHFSERWNNVSDYHLIIKNQYEKSLN